MNEELATTVRERDAAIEACKKLDRMLEDTKAALREIKDCTTEQLVIDCARRALGE